MKDIEAIAKDIVDAAIKVHRILGPGLLESAYQKCFAIELRKRGYKVDCEVVLPILYEGEQIDLGYRIDTIVESCIIVEHKAVEHLLPIHEAQLLTYMKLGNITLGSLLNWNTTLMKNGMKRMVLHYRERV